jgi:hypothetical protein
VLSLDTNLQLTQAKLTFRFAYFDSETQIPIKPHLSPIFLKAGIHIQKI